MKKLVLLSLITLLFCSCFGQEIILLRHSKVALEQRGWMTAKKAATFREKYNNAPIYKFDKDTVLSKLPIKITDTIYVSTLPRSIATAILLYADSSEIVSTGLLNEFELQIVRLPLILPYKAWTAVSRTFWLMGLEKEGTESYKEARQRVRLIADMIEEKTATQQQLIFVTHGFVNRNIAKELKRRGWTITQNQGKKNLGATVLKK